MNPKSRATVVKTTIPVTNVSSPLPGSASTISSLAMSRSSAGQVAGLVDGGDLVALADVHPVLLQRLAALALRDDGGLVIEDLVHDDHRDELVAAIDGQLVADLDLVLRAHGDEVDVLLGVGGQDHALDRSRRDADAARVLLAPQGVLGVQGLVALGQLDLRLLGGLEHRGGVAELVREPLLLG